MYMRTATQSDTGKYLLRPQAAIRLPAMSANMFQLTNHARYHIPLQDAQLLLHPVHSPH